MKYIVVDVDGVLNSFGSPGEHSILTTGTVQDSTFRLQLDSRHGEWLKNLAKETDSTLLWGTTWDQWANEQIGVHIGLNIFAPDLGYRGYSQTNASWKANGVLRYVGDSPLVWFDDDFEISYYMGNKQHHIKIEPYKGLTQDHIALARRILLDME